MDARTKVGLMLVTPAVAGVAGTVLYATYKLATCNLPLSAITTVIAVMFVAGLVLLMGDAAVY